jgi:hypothetical protein
MNGFSTADSLYHLSQSIYEKAYTSKPVATDEINTGTKCGAAELAENLCLSAWAERTGS